MTLLSSTLAADRFSAFAPLSHRRMNRIQFVETFVRLVNATAPGFEREGKRYLTVAVGCTGGKHRSVAMAEEFARRLSAEGVPATARHRDLGRE